MTYENASNTRRMAAQAMADSKRWFPDTATSLTVYTLGLVGESGEFADEVKKILRGSQHLADAKTRHKVIMELADAYTYMLLLSDLLGFDLEKAYFQKRIVNEQRFGPGDKSNSGGK